MSQLFGAEQRRHSPQRPTSSTSSHANTYGIDTRISEFNEPFTAAVHKSAILLQPQWPEQRTAVTLHIWIWSLSRCCDYCDSYCT